MFKLANIQVGKSGVTENFIQTLKNHFKNHENVKVSVLKSRTRDKEQIRKMSDEILNKLGKNYTARVIGFTIVIKKWRKLVRE
ncbi:YhbY family RNA-binding protein [Candidatus Pacearchaeota archaeon]|nr:YhbY family RNA-binding protein [Candidatus Pacearchaeota archaeon]